MNFFLRNNTPRWLILLIDTIICALAVIIAYLVRFNFKMLAREAGEIPKVFAIMVSIRFVSFLISRTYAGIIRYTNTRDSVRIFLVLSAGSTIFMLINLTTLFFITGTFILPSSVIIIEYMFTMFMMIAFRILTKIAYMELQNPTKAKTNVIIFGAGESGVITKRTLDRDAGTKYKVTAFIDDDINKTGKTLEGSPIYSFDKLESLLESKTIAQVIISIQHINSSRKKEISELCLQHGTKVLVVPPVERWINGELSFKQIKKINIEDLLGREVIQLDEKEISKQLHEKVILVTGAAGSIGSEMVRQILQFSPKKIILLDQAETPLFHLELELLEKFRNAPFEIVMGDICNKERMKRLFEYFRPQHVYHAAAYKHVPMMENNPSEAVFTNVEGTRIIADLSLEYQVEKFVMISTDKAVRPTSVMGASKRIAEIYTQSLNKLNKTKFITTRFGNVLGSSGSVIPLFKEQIEKGGPVTITDENITRYFMTIPEACRLVLEAGALGKGGEIFIFDMGKSVRIVDLAKKMIQLSGLTLGKDIQITYTGLRPGEKLYEELLNDKENTLPTHHPQIMIAKVQETNIENIKKNIDELSLLFNTQNNIDIVRKMKQIVPEFISNNSVFSELDN
ncbi:MAG TPA: nucleoside-diphosphate sugar epimerase/dehydratase [Bacteroidales bacterium]|nr:nucleoside-diphosphate sugar epimerase/dehydratase [Bacteroidales bacterium]HPS17500.1 nucleoside-diphosphate sugar epimerase/dehydratase [Bacteroidales bacterium]